MLKRVLPYIVTALISAVVVSIFRPFEGVGAFAQQGGCQTFKETGKTVCGRFLTYWNSNGGLRQQGFPISGEMPEVSDLDGKSYTVQYFERSVFEYHPENSAPNDVLLSQLGTFRYASKYGTVQKVPTRTFQLGERADVAPGVWITVLNVEIGDYATWRGVIHNDSDSVFNFRLNKDSMGMLDSTGRAYNVFDRSPSNLPNGDIKPHSDANIVIVAEVFPRLYPIAPAAKYLALYLYNLSGTGPYVFYRQL